MRLIAFSSVLFLMFAEIGCVARSSEHIGAQAPDFTLPLVSDPKQKINLTETAKEGPVLLVFWASWCPTCVEEIPEVNHVYQEWSPKGLKILGVNVQEPQNDVLQFMKAQPIDYPVVLDEEGDVADKFGLVGLPSAVVLAKGGEIIYYGFSLPRNLSELLNQRRSQTR